MNYGEEEWVIRLNNTEEECKFLTFTPKKKEECKL